MKLQRQLACLREVQEHRREERYTVILFYFYLASRFWGFGVLIFVWHSITAQGVSQEHAHAIVIVRTSSAVARSMQRYAFWASPLLVLTTTVWSDNLLFCTFLPRLDYGSQEVAMWEHSKTRICTIISSAWNIAYIDPWSQNNGTNK